jgi:hypothetical protein
MEVVIILTIVKPSSNKFPLIKYNVARLRPSPYILKTATKYEKKYGEKVWEKGFKKGWKIPKVKTLGVFFFILGQPLTCALNHFEVVKCKSTANNRFDDKILMSPNQVNV